MKINKYIIKNNHIRYAILFLTFALVLLIGKKLTDPYMAISESYTNPYTTAKYVMPSDSSKLIINGYDFKKGKTYNISFIAENITNPEGSEEGEYTYSISTIDNSNNVHSISDFKIYVNKTTHFSYNFSVNNDSKIISISRKDSENNVFRIKQFYVSETNNKDIVTINSINYYKKSFTNNAQNISKIFSLYKKKEIVGKSFIANTDYIDGASFNIEFVGNGGTYGHTISLWELNEGDKFKLGNKISTYSFRTKFAKDHLRDSYKENIYRFPINSKVNKGKKYFIGFENTAITNSANHLSFFGDDTEKEKGDSYAIKTNGKVNKIGNLFVNIYGDNLNKIEYSNGFIEHKSPDGNKYIYDSNFDIFNKNMTNVTENEKIYTFEFEELINNINIKTNLYDKNTNYYYSIDGKEWKKIDENNIYDNLILLNNLNSKYISLKIDLKYSIKPVILNGLEAFSK